MVDYITSSGERVSTLVTSMFVFEKSEDGKLVLADSQITFVPPRLRVV